jgi:hypothetical protein
MVPVSDTLALLLGLALIVFVWVAARRALDRHRPDDR